jgi:predicted GIY-YIG superfamily endonuclease
MKNKGIVYKVTHTESCKSYIGITTKSLDTRKKDHLKKSTKGKSYEFQQAISTYGQEAFKWEQIDTATSIDELARKEKEYILEYNSKEDGFNSDIGGGVQKTVYQYDKNGVLVNSFSNLTSAGNAVNAAKSSVSQAALGFSLTCKGYLWSYSSIFPKHINDNRRKVVQQFSLEGKFVNEFKSVSEASKLTDCNKTSIAKTCRGERKSCGGFIWKYL